MRPFPLFEKLGLQYWALENGVYLLRSRPNGTETCTLFVGLILFQPEMGPASNIRFFRLEIPDPIESQAMLKAWQDLDARRLEESGLVPFVCGQADGGLGDVVARETYNRPDGVRVRHAVRLRTGEVACLN